MVATRLLLYVDARFVSPFAMTAFVALDEKRAPFDLLTVDLDKKGQLEPEYTATSLTSKVPTLVHGDFALSESSAIAEYVDETFAGTALYPEDPQLRARARQIQAWLRTDLMPIRQERSSENLFYKTRPEPLSGEAARAAEKLFFLSEQLLPADSRELFGKWSIADFELAFMLNRLVMSGDPVPRRLASYAEHQWQRPSVLRWVSMVRPAR